MRGVASPRFGLKLSSQDRKRRLVYSTSAAPRLLCTRSAPGRDATGDSNSASGQKWRESHRVTHVRSCPESGRSPNSSPRPFSCHIQTSDKEKSPPMRQGFVIASYAMGQPPSAGGSNYSRRRDYGLFAHASPEQQSQMGTPSWGNCARVGQARRLEATERITINRGQLNLTRREPATWKVQWQHRQTKKN